MYVGRPDASDEVVDVAIAIPLLVSVTVVGVGANVQTVGSFTVVAESVAVGSIVCGAKAGVSDVLDTVVADEVGTASVVVAGVVETSDVVIAAVVVG